MGAQHVVHRREVGVLDLRVHREGRPLGLGQERRLNVGGAAAQEAPGQQRVAVAFVALIAELLQREVHLVDEDAVLRVRIRVDEADLAVHHPDVLDVQDHVARVAHLLRRLGAFLDDLLVGRRRHRLVAVLRDEAVHLKALQPDGGDLGRVLDVTAPADGPARDGHVGAREHRREVVERDVAEHHVALDPRVGLQQEIGEAVHAELPALEDHRLDLDRRRVLALRRPHIADVPHHRLDLGHAQRLRLARLDVGRFAVDDLELVDLERVHGLQGVLPAVVLHGRRIVQLGLEVLAVDVDDRLDQLEVGDQLAVDQRAPLYAGREPLDPHHGRVGIGVLHHPDVVEVDGEPDGVEVELADVGRVALHLPVHLALGHAAQRLVEEDRDDEREHDDDDHRDREPEPVAARPAPEPAEGIPHALPRLPGEQAQCQRGNIAA